LFVCFQKLVKPEEERSQHEQFDGLRVMVLIIMVAIGLIFSSVYRRCAMMPPSVVAGNASYGVRYSAAQ
jgi:hypothetical protein